jgi:regulator of sigma E protease
MNLQILAIVPILSVLLICHELGHFFTARWSGITVEEFGIGLPPRLFGFRRGGILYSLNLIPFGAFVRMLGEEDPTAPGSFARKPKWIRGLVLAAGSFMNFLLAVLAFALAFMTGVPTVANATAVEVMTVSPNSPAQQAGLLQGDRILTINGQPSIPLEQFRKITADNLGKPVTLQVERAGAQQTLTVTPRQNPPEGQGAIGVSIEPFGPVVPHTFGVFEAFWLGLKAAVGVIVTTLSIPYLLLTHMIPAEAARPVGLPGMAQLASQAAETTVQTGWWFPVLSLTGYISAGLSLANMLPLPALDGGRFLFVIIEAVRGKRISPEREAAVHFVGLVALLALMILISLNDINSPLPQVNWGVR